MRAPLVVSLLAVAALAPACRRAPEPATPTTIDSPAFGVRLAAMPEGFSLVANGADGMVLARGSEANGRLVVTAPRPSGAVNLVEAVKARQREVEAAGGRFLGSRELRTPWGPAYTARSRRSDAGAAEREETVVYALHPGDPERLLVVAYAYPAGDDTTARIQQLLDVVAQVDPL